MLSLYVLLLVSTLISGVVVAQQELFPLAQQQIIFLKSLDGEKFRTDLAPSKPRLSSSSEPEISLI